MSESLRERTRRAVRQEITEAATALFVERGYDATTIDDIADAVGMSRRSVFRYFPTKEDLVVGKFDLIADELLAALRARPAGEPLWESLRRAFDLLVPHVDAPGQAAIAEPIQHAVFGTPSLFASYLLKLQHLQDAAEVWVRERGVYAADDPAPRAVVGAAFACLLAAQRSWLAAGGSGTFGAAIDRAMSAVEPAV